MRLYKGDFARGDFSCGRDDLFSTPCPVNIIRVDNSQLKWKLINRKEMGREEDKCWQKKEEQSLERQGDKEKHELDVIKGDNGRVDKQVMKKGLVKALKL